jgi:hypothetical protein
MNPRTKACAILVLAVSAHGAWAQTAGPQLFIGALSGVKRPDGFTVEDARSEAMKTSSRQQTYHRPAFSFNNGPVAKYRRNFGDKELSAAPVDLLAEKLVEHYGDKLKGKKLTVEEFSVVAEETVTRQGGGTVSAPGISVGAAIAISIAGTALMQSLVGPGTSVSLRVSIAAKVDGERFEGSDFGSIASQSPLDAPAKIVEQALDIAFYHLEQAEAANAPQEPKAGDAAPAEAIPPAGNKEAGGAQPTPSKVP